MNAQHHVLILGATGRTGGARPDLAAKYQVHDGIVATLFRADKTRMAEVGHLCELATDEDAWQRWRGRMPVIVDAAPAT